MTSPHIIKVVGSLRSGTAFASMLLALHPDCISYHELASYKEDWRSIIDNSDFDYVADCNTYGFLHEAHHPCQVKIFLDRHPKKSHVSANKATGHELTYQQVENAHKMAMKWAIDSGAFIMNEGEVFTIDGMCKLWHTAFGEFVPFPMEKAIQLRKLNIQHHNPVLRFGKGVRFGV